MGLQLSKAKLIPHLLADDNDDDLTKKITQGGLTKYTSRLYFPKAEITQEFALVAMPTRVL